MKLSQQELGVSFGYKRKTSLKTFRVRLHKFTFLSIPKIDLMIKLYFPIFCELVKTPFPFPVSKVPGYLI